MKPNPHDLQLLVQRYKNVKPLTTVWLLFSWDKPRLLLSMLLFITKHSPVWVLPIITANIIDAVSLQPDAWRRKLILNAGIMLFLVLQNFFTTRGFMIIFSRIVRLTEANLRSALVRRLQQLSLSFHQEYDSGRTYAKLMPDVDAIATLGHQFMQSILPAVIGIIFAFIVTVLKDWRVALFFICTIPLAALIIRQFRRRMRDTSHHFRKDLESMSARASEMIQMIPATRAHSAEDTEIERMDHHLSTVASSGQHFDITMATFGAASWVCFNIFSLACLMFTSWLAHHGHLSVGMVVMYQGFYMVIINAVLSLLNILPHFMRGLESIHSVSEILECPDLEENEGKLTVHDVGGAFNFEHVSFTYPGQPAPAVDDFNLYVPSGETVALVGASGSGKSTLINLLIGFRRPTQGRILLDGRDMQTLDLRTYRAHIAVVAQDTLLFNGSIYDNITYGLENITEKQVAQAIEAAFATGFIGDLPQGIHTLIGEHGAKLSGGQRQRIAIARAMIRDPKIIILDEATSALDLIAEREVQLAMERLAAGRTTFIVAHRLSTIRKADRLVVLDNGRIAEIGTHDELLQKKGSYFDLYQMQH